MFFYNTHKAPKAQFAPLTNLLEKSQLENEANCAKHVESINFMIL
jgi:hypothetical protein